MTHTAFPDLQRDLSFHPVHNDNPRVLTHAQIDQYYWPLTPSKMVTVWLAIDDADVENGAMTVIPGSHVHGQLDFEESSREENNVLNQKDKIF